MCFSVVHNLKDGNIIAIYIKWDTIQRATSFNSHHTSLAEHKRKFTLASSSFTEHEHSRCHMLLRTKHNFHQPFQFTIFFDGFEWKFVLNWAILFFDSLSDKSYCESQFAATAHRAIHFSVSHNAYRERPSMIELSQMSSNVNVLHHDWVILHKKSWPGRRYYCYGFRCVRVFRTVHRVLSFLCVRETK